MFLAGFICGAFVSAVLICVLALNANSKENDGGKGNDV